MASPPETITPTQSRSRTDLPKKTARLDIQGLRAIAAVVVILNHLTGWPRGGFIVVDIFLVTSGFLITGQLVGAHDRTGRISLIDFYRRRVRRIVPVSILMLGTVTAVSYLLFRTVRATAIKTDALWSLFFASNWHFAALGTDYLHASDAVSPLQHLWSLGVQEQFYVVWPVLMIVVFAFVGTSRRSQHLVLGLVLAALTAASFSYSVWETATHPTAAYFSTLSRGWELGLGSLLALSAPILARIPKHLRPAMSWLGLATIAAGAFLLTPDSPFPGVLAAVPVGAAGLVISAGIGYQYRSPWVLVNPVSSYIGNISYSLYLWHFPIIIFMGAVTKERDATYYLEVIAIIAAVSVFSYHFIEDPIRRSRWLEPERKVKPSRRSPARGVVRRQRALAAMGVGAALVAATVLVTVQQESTAVAGATAVSDRLAQGAPGSTPVVAVSTGPAVSAAQLALTAQITTALAATTWPSNLSPSLNTLGSQDGAPQWVVDGCLGSGTGAQANAAHCLYGNPKAGKTAVLLGDSVAISYLPGLMTALVPKGWNIRVLTMEKCGWQTVNLSYVPGQPYTLCNTFRQWAIAQVTKLQPNLVVMSSSAATFGRMTAPASTAMAQWTQGAATSLTRLTAANRQLLILAPPPVSPNLQDCATKVSTPTDCQTTISAGYTQSENAIQKVAAGNNINTHYINTEPWFCNTAGQCPSFINSTPVFTDGEHLTSKYSTHLAPLLFDAIDQSGTPAPPTPARK